MDGTEITQNRALMPVMDVQAAVGRYQQMVDFVKQVMESGTDFGIVPGSDKPTLLKPGAEKLCTFFGLSARFDLAAVVEDWTGQDHGEPLFAYTFKSSLYRGDMLIAEGVGSCNSWEKKYRYRQADRVCPKCSKPAIIKGKDEYGGGWLCFGKKGGCGTKWPDGAAEIESQQVGMVPNTDPADLTNTLQKMAQKRALVAATLVAVNASAFFTQDLEEMDITGHPVDPNKPAPQSGPAAQPRPANGKRPYPPEVVRQKIDEKAAAHLGDLATDGQRGLATGMLEACFAGDATSDKKRHTILKHLFGVTSSNDLAAPQVLALLDWLRPQKDSGGAYAPESNAAKEAQAIVTAAMKEAGQGELI